MRWSVGPTPEPEPEPSDSLNEPVPRLNKQVFHPDRLPQACAKANREVAQQIFDRAQKMEQ